MRAAKENDFFREINKEGWPCGVKKIVFENDVFSEKTEINFAPAINFLVGPNGVGKTRLLKSIYEIVKKKFNNPELIDNNIYFYNFNSNSEIVFLHSADIVETYKKYFQTIQDVNSVLLNGLSAKEFEKDDLAEACWLVNKSYESIRIYEVTPSLRIGSESSTDEIYYSEEVVPYFTAKSKGVTYDTRDMGSGEYAALYILWSLKRLEKNSLVFVEEPETFLSFMVQHNLSVLFAKYASLKKSAFTISTHSYPMIQHYRSESIKSLLYFKNKIRLSKKDNSLTYKNIGAIFDRFKYIFLVEDYFSKFCLDFIIKTFYPEHFNRVATFYVKKFIDFPGGATGMVDVYFALKAMQGFDSNIVLVFDGDQINEKGTFLNKKINIDDKLTYPEIDPMEIILRSIVINNTDLFSIENLDEIVFDSEAVDHHEFFQTVAEKCKGIGPEVIQSKAMEIYLEEKKEIISPFVERIGLFLEKIRN